MHDKEIFLSLKEVMELTQLCRAKLHKLCDEGYLIYNRTKGGHRIIARSSVNQLLNWQNEYKVIPGFSDYTISEYGDIRKIKGKQAPRTMPPSIRFDGYYEVALRGDDGKRHYICVHRLVALTYIPNPMNLPQVNHKDENKLNNHISNLEWCTVEYNCNYGTRNQRISEANKGRKRI